MKNSKKESALAESFMAVQLKTNVILIAQGTNNTSGYHVFFEKSLIAIFPPEFILFQIPPTVISSDVITPFTVATSFQSNEIIQHLSVHDKSGKHIISVIKID